MKEHSTEQLLRRIEELESRLEDSENLIDAIKTGEVDAFAIRKENQSEIYTLQSVDYAYRVLIEEFGEGAVSVTEEGLIVYTNPYFLSLLRLPYEKIVGASIFDYVHPSTKEQFEAIFKEALSGRSKGELSLICGETKIPVYISMTSLQPKLATVGIIITDLTEKKQHEETILEYQRQLEVKNYELEQSNSELNSFTYAASHDLQEPLRKIQTFAAMIEKKELGNLSATALDYFGRMQNASKRMQKLIENLLAYSRTATAEREFENTDLRNIIADVENDLKEEIQLKNAIITVTSSCQIQIIRFQFRQLLLNLVSNSLKFTNPKIPPHITIACDINTGQQLENQNLEKEKLYSHITISDNGIGFEQEYEEKIFVMFQRLHGKNQYEGTGIGLAIVKKIVENHQGFISVKSEKGKGTRFDIYIPTQTD